MTERQNTLATYRAEKPRQHKASFQQQWRQSIPLEKGSHVLGMKASAKETDTTTTVNTRERGTTAAKHPPERDVHR
jgi:hypothetical protein